MSKKEAAEKIRFYSFLSRKDRGRVKAMWVNQKKKKEGEKKNAFLKSKKKKMKGMSYILQSFSSPSPFFPPSFLLTSYTDGKSINRNLNLGSKTMKKKKKRQKEK